MHTHGSSLTIAEGECLGFGRLNLEPGGTKGWGYQGRFVELAAESYVHRIWADLVWHNGLWHVRSLGARHPVVVVPHGYRPIELPPLPPDGSPHQYAVTQQEFEVVLAVAADEYRISCAATVEPLAPEDLGPHGGDRTMTAGGELVGGITATEFQVLWVMAREYRSDPPVAEPEPLSYARIVRALELTSDKQAVGAVERMMRRFRAADLVPATLPVAQQRDWICRQSIAHGLLDALCEQHGTPSTP